MDRSQPLQSTTILHSTVWKTLPYLAFFVDIDTATLTPGKLPLTPEITPGFAVAGVILILSGAIYTIIGIKNRYLHIYLSAAYLAGLAVTVLIIYVMNPPIRNAIQGAYVVAVVMTGLILGGAAIAFPELTEGLGCLLGGFCLSMWLLVLKSGGLLTSTGGRAGFIAAFTIAAFCTSFSHITRPYALICFISFGGATAVVLGIDCFSRAGLKEFWAYLWNLNTNLFPLGATTYPVTRGIRVEIAAIVIIFVAGVASQMKLWKVIKERRQQRAAERLEDERALEQEEENIGRRVEDDSARERSQWEAVYGDKDEFKTMPSNRDSGVGDMDSQKKGPMSTVTSPRNSDEGNIEMVEVPVTSPTAPGVASDTGLVMTSKDHDGAVTVRVARDIIQPESGGDENGVPIVSPDHASHVPAQDPIQEEKVWVVGADGEARLERRASQRSSKQASGAPEVVPLPFKVPEGEAEDDRSSVATFADDVPAEETRQSKRFSAGSALLRRISQRSQRSSKRFSRGEGESTEDLVVPRAFEDDRASSIAATMDELSDDEDMLSTRSSMENTDDDATIRPSGQVGSVVGDEAPSPESASKATEEALAGSSKEATEGPISATAEGSGNPETVQTEESTIVERQADVPKVENREDEQEVVEQQVEEPVVQQSLTSSTDPKPIPQTNSTPEVDSGEHEDEKPADGTPSAVSAAVLKPANLTKEHLPNQLSKVVTSYRTNEWAKHLGNAEVPELEELQLEDPVDDQTTVAEPAVPVDVEELQQTPENALPPPASSISQMSNRPSHLMRSNSAPSGLPPPRPETSTGLLEHGTVPRTVSQQSLRSQTSQQNVKARGLRSPSSPNIPQPIVESPVEEDSGESLPVESRRSPSPYVSFSPGNTLMGKRSTMLRNRISYASKLSATSPTPEPPQQQLDNPIPSQQKGDGEPVYNTNYLNHSSPAVLDDDDMLLSERRNMIRQASLQQLTSASMQQPPTPFDSHQPRRQSSVPGPIQREYQLASWRESVQQDLQSTAKPTRAIERRRSTLWLEKRAEEEKKALEQKKKEGRDSAFDQRMRRGDLLELHREALRKMQAAANKKL
jgi:hypothetical protein